MMAEEFARRRRQLMRLMGRDAIAVLPAAPARTRNNDVCYNFRQLKDNSVSPRDSPVGPGPASALS